MRRQCTRRRQASTLDRPTARITSRSREPMAMTGTPRTSTHARTYLMCPPRAFRRGVRHQSMDEPSSAGRPRPGNAAVAAAEGHVRQSRPHRAHDHARAGPAGHGVRRQRRDRHRRQGPGCQVQARRAAAGGSGLPGLVPRARLRHRPGLGHRQRGRGRHRVRRTRHPGGPRLPQRTRRSGRADRAVRAAGDQPAAGGPALLPPRHRACRARCRHRRVLPGGDSTMQAGPR